MWSALVLAITQILKADVVNDLGDSTILRGQLAIAASKTYAHRGGTKIHVIIPE